MTKAIDNVVAHFDSQEIKKIEEAKKKGQIYISPLIFGDNAVA